MKNLAHSAGYELVFLILEYDLHKREVNFLRCRKLKINDQGK
jgi:hypothetical protein